MTLQELLEEWRELPCVRVYSPYVTPVYASGASLLDEVVRMGVGDEPVERVEGHRALGEKGRLLAVAYDTWKEFFDAHRLTEEARGRIAQAVASATAGGNLNGGKMVFSMDGSGGEWYAADARVPVADDCLVVEVPVRTMTTAEVLPLVPSYTSAARRTAALPDEEPDSLRG